MKEEDITNKKLVKRKYLGEGFYHHFRNNQTGEEVSVECSRKEYEALGLPNAGPAVLAGHTWLCSDGGTTRVDTPSGFLGDDEYTVKGNHVVARLGGMEHNLAVDSVKEDGALDPTKLPHK